MQHDKKSLVAVLIFSLGILFSSYSQDKKMITRDDYHLWTGLVNLGLSPNGDWALYNLVNEKVDTLFLKSTKNGNRISFINGQQGTFSNTSDWFACMVGGDMQLIRLSNLGRSNFSQISSYAFSVNGKFLAMAKKDSVGSNTYHLTLKNLDNGKMVNIDHVTEYSFNPKTNSIAIVISGGVNAVNIIDLNDFKVHNLEQSATNLEFVGISWHPSGESLVFLQEIKDSLHAVTDHSIIFYRHLNGTPNRNVFDPAQNTLIGDKNFIPFNTQTKLFIADDQERVFFEVKETPKPSTEPHKPDSSVEVWGTMDEELYPLMNLKGYWSNEPKLAVWQTANTNYFQIGTQDQPISILSGGQKYALTFHPNRNKSLETFNPDRDIYLVDLKSHRRDFLIRIPGDQDIRPISISPAGDYVAYFKDRHWWVYGIKEKTHTNLSANLPFPIEDESYDRAGDKPPYDNIVWAQDDSKLFITDAFDIWSLMPDGSHIENLTKSRNKGVRYRIQEDLTATTPWEYPLWRSFYAPSIPRGTPVILHSFNPITKESGYSIMTSDKGVKKLDFGSQKVSYIKHSKNYSTWSFISESFNKPLSLMLSAGKKLGKLVTTNGQQAKFKALRAELIPYHGMNDAKLQGILYYPTDFEKGKQYPMVTVVYETFSDDFFEYINPGLLINPWNVGYRELLNKGYFVFLPDINYVLNEVAHSATTCVLSGVNEVLKKGNVNPNALGLMGYSFGGFEVNCIVSETDLFAAAAPGAGPSDAISFYFMIGKNDSKSEIFRYEHGMWRFRGPFHKNKKAYLKNSPIYNSDKINTPLLIFTGQEDGQVNSDQSVEMYLALRRLEKPGIMLVYPKEDHVLLNGNNQLDISNKLLDWFNYYLKPDVGPSPWMRSLEIKKTAR